MVPGHEQPGHHVTARARSRGRCVVSAVLARGVVLLHHARGDTAPLTDLDALVFRPGPDVAAALPAGRGPPRAAAPPGLAGVLDERRQLLAERAGVLGAQIDLVLG